MSSVQQRDHLCDSCMNIGYDYVMKHRLDKEGDGNPVMQEKIMHEAGNMVEDHMCVHEEDPDQNYGWVCTCACRQNKRKIKRM